MNTILKSFAIIFILVIAASIMDLWFKTFIIDQYFIHGSIFMNVLFGAVVPLFITIVTFQSIKSIIKA